MFDWRGEAESIRPRNPYVDLNVQTGILIGTGISPGIAWERLEIRRLDAGDYSLNFDGRSSFVETPIRYDGSHPLTIEALVTPRAVIDENQLLVGDSQASGLALMLRDDGHWHFGIWDRKHRDYVRATSENPAVANQRVHLAGVLDGNQVRLYVDGKLQGEPAELDQIVPSELPMMIGANWEPGNRFWEHFAGVMDEVRISKIARYNGANFAPEVRFNSDEQTLGLYHFDEGSGKTARDSSANDAHALVVNSNWMRVGSSAQTEPHKSDTAEQEFPENVVRIGNTESEISSDTTNSLGMSLQRISAGEFMMGRE